MQFVNNVPNIQETENDHDHEWIAETRFNKHTRGLLNINTKLVTKQVRYCVT